MSDLRMQRLGQASADDMELYNLRKARLDQLAAEDAAGTYQSPAETVAALRADLDEKQPSVMATKAEVVALRAIVAAFLSHFAEIIGRRDDAEAVNQGLRNLTMRTVENATFSSAPETLEAFKAAVISEAEAFFGSIDDCCQTFTAMAESGGKTKS
jgi:hypothetical protein